LAPTCAGYTFKSEEEAANYGWRLDHGVWQPLGELIGWFDGEEIYLEPEIAFAMVQKLGRDQGRPLAVTPKTLWKRLAEKHLLSSSDKNQNTIRKTIKGRRRRVIHLASRLLNQPPSALADSYVSEAMD